MAESVVTPIRPAAAVTDKAAKKQRRKRVDPTNADRQRRHRARQTGPAQAVSNVTPVLSAAPVATASEAVSQRISWSVWPLAGTTVGLMAVSLTHLAGGIGELTGIPAWQQWAMAGGIDCMLVSVALAMLTATIEAKREIATVAHCMEAGTLIMSAGLNALAFTGGVFDLAHSAQIAFGCFMPAAISGATYILARLTRRG
jgi:hypothetical protein